MAERDERNDGACARPVPAPIAAREPFVGRVAQLRRMLETAAKVATGESWLILVDGDPGAGKTALVRRFLGVLGGFDVVEAAADRA